MDRGFDDVLGVTFTKGKSGKKKTVRFGKRAPSERVPAVRSISSSGEDQALDQAFDWMDDCEQVITGRRPGKPKKKKTKASSRTRAKAKKKTKTRTPRPTADLDSALEWMDGCEEVIQAKRRPTTRVEKARGQASTHESARSKKASGRSKKASSRSKTTSSRSKTTSSRSKTTSSRSKTTSSRSKKASARVKKASARVQKASARTKQASARVKKASTQKRKKSSRRSKVDLGWMDGVGSDECLIEPIKPRRPVERPTRDVRGMAAETRRQTGVQKKTIRIEKKTVGLQKASVPVKKTKPIVKGPGRVVKKVVKRKPPSVEFVRRGRTLPEPELSPSDVQMLAANPNEIFESDLGRAPLPPVRSDRSAPKAAKRSASRRESGRLRREKLRKSLIESSIEGPAIQTQDELLRRALESSDVGPAIEDTRRVYAAPPEAFAPPPDRLDSPFSESEVWIPFAEPPKPKPKKRTPTTTKLERLKMKNRPLTESSWG